MQALKILIVEDVKEEALHLEAALKQLGYEIVGMADSVESALGLYYTYVPDLVVADIVLNGKKDGILIAEKIMEGALRAKPVIFLTHLLDQHTFEMAKQTNPFNYLLKPFNMQELQFAIELAVERSIQAPGLFTSASETSAMAHSEIYFKKGNYLFKVPHSEIYFVEVEGKYCSVITGENRFLVQRSLVELEKDLPLDFFRTHRNYIVNTSKIKRIDMTDVEIEMSNNKIIPISKTFRSSFFSRMKIMQ